MADWKQKYNAEWQLEAKGVPLPDNVDWKTVYEKKPLERNLLKNPSPHGKAVTSQTNVIQQNGVKSELLCLHSYNNSFTFEVLKHSGCKQSACLK